MYSAGILRSQSTFFETRLRVPMTTHVVDSDNSTISLLCNSLLLDAPYFIISISTRLSFCQVTLIL